MPHASDLLPTDHDRHDALLVAALAARDLTGADRDLATDLIRTCSDCSALHDDLVAIANATSVVPPPITRTPRDFRLTPADAARLRPAGWRRLGDLLRAPGLAAMRPLGAGLTTLGLVGLLIGNVQVAPANPATGAAGAQRDGATSSIASEHAMLSAASSGPDTAGGPGTEVQPAASAAAAPPADAGASAGVQANRPDASPAAGGVAAADPSRQASPDARVGGSAQDLMTESTVVDSARPLNLLFIAAIVVGLALLVVARWRSRPTA